MTIPELTHLMLAPVLAEAQLHPLLTGDAGVELSCLMLSADRELSWLLLAAVLQPCQIWKDLRPDLFSLHCLQKCEGVALELSISLASAEHV